jgi:putative ABC transport system permease protein
MRWYYTLRLRWRSLFRRDKADLELSEELQFRLQNQIDEYLARGVNAEEARRAALLSLGGVEQVKEQCRETRRVALIENVLQEVHFGFRMLRRSPGFSILAVLCLTLGIGANGAVFSWVEGLLLRPYPLVSNQERLVALSGTVRDERDQTSWPDLLDVQRSCTLCETVFVSNITGAILSLGERAEVTTRSIVSANYFDAIGVPPFWVAAFGWGKTLAATRIRWWSSATIFGSPASPGIQRSSARRSALIAWCTPLSGSHPLGSTGLS